MSVSLTPTGLTGTVVGTRFFMQFPPSTPVANGGGSEVTFYQNGALTSGDASLINTPIPAKCKVLKMRCYVNSALSGGGARVYVTQNGTAITGTNREIDVTQGTVMFEANDVNLTLDEGNRVGIRIILEPGATAAWYHVNLECVFVT
jgi:hypothetical protein